LHPKSLKKGSGSEPGSGSSIQRYGSADPVPDAHQNVMDPQYWVYLTNGSLSTQENPEALRYTAVSSGTGEGDFEKMKAILAAVPEVP
jgi:hypothetical protein